METTVDAFLGGKISIEQPKNGYRAATDPVFLAAATKARSGQTILDVGCGVGTASFCLQARTPDLAVSGLELQAEYAELAKLNSVRNNMPLNVHIGSLQDPPTALRAQSFDIVVTNPPYFPMSSGTTAHNSGKSIANSSIIPTRQWVLDCLRRIKPLGQIYIIQRADQLGEIIAGLDGRAGDIKILPLAPRLDRDAKRVIVSARKGAKGPLSLLPPLTIHEGSEHGDTSDGYTSQVSGILRSGHILPM